MRTPALSTKVAEGLQKLDTQPLVESIRKGQVKTPDALGKFVRSLLEHPKLGELPLTTESGPGTLRRNACFAFAVEALTASAVENQAHARILADAMHPFSAVVLQNLPHNRQAVDDYIANAVQTLENKLGETQARRVLQEFNENIKKNPFGATDRQTLDEIGDSKLLGRNSGKIIREKGIQPDRSYVAHLWAVSTFHVSSLAAILLLHLTQQNKIE